MQVMKVATQCLFSQENKYCIATFITCIGEDVLEVFNGLPFENKDYREDIGKMLELMERYKRNRFNKTVVNHLKFSLQPSELWQKQVISAP